MDAIQDIAKRMLENEQQHETIIDSGRYIVLRLDGRNFSKLTEGDYQKPFDAQFNRCMCRTTITLTTELQCIYAYTGSDEISLLFPKETTMFNRRANKFLSLSASIASVAFSEWVSFPAQFDSRLLVFDTQSATNDYFFWRQEDVRRNALQSLLYWTLRSENGSAKMATRVMTGMSLTEMSELLKQRSITFTNLPLCQQHGTAFYWEDYQKDGFNPLTREKVVVSRRKMVETEDLGPWVTGQRLNIFERIGHHE